MKTRVLLSKAVVAGDHLRAAALAGAHALVVAMALTLAAGPAGAVSTKYFLHDTADEWARGEPDGVSITSDGTLRLAPHVDVIAEPEAPYLWDLAVDRARGVIYAGAGDDGWILRVHGNDVTEFFQCAAIWSLAVLVDDRGSLYAGTGPEGFLYRIDPDGKGEVIFDAEEPYLWDMVFGPDGMIYAGFGPGAVVYRVDPASGEAERFFEVDDHHVASLAFDDEGRLLVGTEGRGLVVRVDPVKGFL